MIKGAKNFQVLFHPSIPVSAWILIGSIIMLLNSCIKEEFDPDKFDPSLQITTGVAAPIGWAEYRLGELFDSLFTDDELLIGEDGSISFVYTDSLFSLSASEFLSIPDISAPPFSISTDANLPLPPGILKIDSMDFQLNLELNNSSGEEIDRIRFNEAILNVNLSGPDLDSVGWAVKVEIGRDRDYTWVTSGLQSDTLISESLQLVPPNIIPVKILINLDNPFDDTIIVIDPLDFDVEISITGIDFNALYGYLGVFQIGAGPVNMPVNFYNKLEAGTFTFKDPRLTLNFDNSFGVPLAIDTLDLVIIDRNGIPEPITGAGIPPPGTIELDYPGLSQEGDIVNTDHILNRENTDNLFSSLLSTPSGMRINAGGSSYPGGPQHGNFIMDESRLDINAELLLPMEGIAQFQVMSDTLDFVFSDFFDNPPEEIKQLIFRINFRHQFPLDVRMQVYFYDGSGAVLDSLFHDTQDPKRVVEGSREFTGDVANEVWTDPVEVALTKDQINNITDCDFIIVLAEVVTTENNGDKNVKFYSYYFFNAWLGVIAELELNSDNY